MKKVWLFILMVLSTGCFLVAVSAWGEINGVRLQPGIAREVIRFHVRANSEDTLDQEIKLQVKDAVVAYLQPVLAFAENKTQAEMILSSRLEEIRQAAEETLEKYGYTYGATVSLKKEHFPQKTYGDCTFPAGDYSAVVIELGSGRGRNWWCMLYPGLCFVDETYAVVSREKKEELQHVLTDEAYDWITDPGNRKVTFRWDWLGALVREIRN